MFIFNGNHYDTKELAEEARLNHIRHSSRISSDIYWLSNQTLDALYTLSTILGTQLDVYVKRDAFFSYLKDFIRPEYMPITEELEDGWYVGELHGVRQPILKQTVTHEQRAWYDWAKMNNKSGCDFKYGQWKDVKNPVKLNLS